MRTSRHELRARKQTNCQRSDANSAERWLEKVFRGTPCHGKEPTSKSRQRQKKKKTANDAYPLPRAHSAKERTSQNSLPLNHVDAMSAVKGMATLPPAGYAVLSPAGPSLVLWAVGVFNNLICLHGKPRQTFANIGGTLKSRHGGISNLVEVYRDYMGHEAEVLERITARQNSYQVTDSTRSKVLAWTPVDPQPLVILSEDETLEEGEKVLLIDSARRQGGTISISEDDSARSFFHRCTRLCALHLLGRAAKSGMCTATFFRPASLLLPMG